MMDMQPTYFLYSGHLFREAAMAFLGDPKRREEDPGPQGPEGEPVGDDDDDTEVEPTPAPGFGAPLVPDHGSPDANPIDPRVFLSLEHH